ncbi:MAG: FecR domain-containing protein [Bacteroidales bacterium]|nr:FecR domain-containing protein [Bacteroidales bacterium]
MNSKDKAREKYLLFKSLDAKEKKVIEEDLNGDDFARFRQQDNQPLLISGKYSAASTYVLVQKRIHTRATRWKRWAVAASILLLIGLGSSSLFYYSFLRTVTIATGYGEVQEIVLPDQSVVKLNALSSVSYPVRFSKKDREIRLSGEAFFDVTKDEDKPFRVFTDNFFIEVLGTRFNVQSYANESIQETALLEGLIAIHYGNQQQIINPGQSAFYDRSKETLTVKEESHSSVWQWQDNLLVFDHISLEKIVRILERNYDANIEIDGDSSELYLTARFTKEKSLEEILDVLSFTNHFTYSKKGNKYVIYPQEED